MEILDMMKRWAADFFGDAVGWCGAAAGLLIGVWTELPALAQAILIVQAADVATGLCCALLGESPKSDNGRVSSRAMLEGVIRKGAEWLIVLVCFAAGSPLGMEGISSAAMTYVIATELVSLLENFELLGFDVPLLHTILDVAHGQKTD